MFTSRTARTLTIGYVIGDHDMGKNLYPYSWIMRGLPLKSDHVNTINHVNMRAKRMFDEINSHELVVNTWRAPSDLYTGNGRHTYRVVRGERSAYGLPPYIVIGSVTYDNIHEVFRLRIVYDSPGSTEGDSVVLLQENVNTGDNETLAMWVANVLTTSIMNAADYVLALGGDYAVLSNYHQVTPEEVIEEVLQLANVYVPDHANRYGSDSPYIRGFCRSVLNNAADDLLVKVAAKQREYAPF